MLEFAGDHARIACGWGDCEQRVGCASVVTITARLPEDAWCREMQPRQAEWVDVGIPRVDCIGDAHAPGLIVHSVYAGHRYAREFDDPRSHEERVDSVPFRRQRPVL